LAELRSTAPHNHALLAQPSHGVLIARFVVCGLAPWDAQRLAHGERRFWQEGVGLSNHEIAEQLSLSAATVKTRLTAASGSERPEAEAC
jgi:hypothetical protein